MQPIKDTGIKGFLKWFAREQPEIYKKIAPQLPRVAPAAFSGFNGGGWREIYASEFRHRSPQNLGQYASYTSYAPQVDYSAQLASSPLTAEISLPAYTAYTSSPTSASGTISMPPIDTYTAANSGTASSTTTAQIGATIAAATLAAGLTVAQANAQNNLVQAQLQRAQSGLRPMNTTLSSVGVPTVGGSSLLSGNTGLLLLLALGGGAILLATSKK